MKYLLLLAFLFAACQNESGRINPLQARLDSLKKEEAWLVREYTNCEDSIMGANASDFQFAGHTTDTAYLRSCLILMEKRLKLVRSGIRELEQYQFAAE